MLNTVIVDDELLARQVLEEYVSKIEELHLVLSTGSPIEFLNFVSQQKIDLVFLDIEMPELTGMELLRSSLQNTKVILTTAYSEYALESYDYGVVDYLLKPVKLERFLKAMNKVIEPKAGVSKVKEPLELSFRYEGLPLSIPLHDILFIQSFGNYLKIFTEKRMYLITETLTNISTQLPTGFQQTHKSYIANFEKIDQVTNSSLYIRQHQIPISASYKILVRKKLLDLDAN
jgi:two-component system, LytTR family, response regulator LytT